MERGVGEKTASVCVIKIPPKPYIDQSWTECLKLTKAVQKTCETLQTVANLYDGHVRDIYAYYQITVQLISCLARHAELNWQHTNLSN